MAKKENTEEYERKDGAGKDNEDGRRFVQKLGTDMIGSSNEEILNMSEEDRRRMENVNDGMYPTFDDYEEAVKNSNEKSMNMSKEDIKKKKR